MSKQTKFTNLEFVSGSWGFSDGRRISISAKSSVSEDDDDYSYSSGYRFSDRSSSQTTSFVRCPAAITSFGSSYEDYQEDD
jgi:hypothetical protein